MGSITAADGNGKEQSNGINSLQSSGIIKDLTNTITKYNRNKIREALVRTGRGH